MKLPPYTLVRRARFGSGEPSNSFEKKIMKKVDDGKSDLTRSMLSLSGPFRRSLLSSTVGTGLGPGLERSLNSLKCSVKEVMRAPRVYTVGFWDVSSQVGHLPDVIAALNKAQPTFAFFELQAAVPAGLLSRPERVEEWARDRTGSLSRSEKKEFRSNVIFEQFETRAKVVRKGFGIDYLVGIVPSMVALEDDDSIYWNGLSAQNGPIMLFSTHDLYAYAKKAGRSFEVAAANVAISILLASINPKLDFHAQTRGCLFDFNKKRSTFVYSLIDPRIEPRCMDLISPKYRSAAQALVQVLGKYKRGGNPRTA